jgi:hypothetical protein
VQLARGLLAELVAIAKKERRRGLDQSDRQRPGHGVDLDADQIGSSQCRRHACSCSAERARRAGVLRPVDVLIRGNPEFPVDDRRAAKIVVRAVTMLLYRACHLPPIDLLRCV